MNAEILTLIGSYGFPIIACICMGYYVKDQSDKNREEIEKLNERHRTEMNEVTTALNNNTIALEKLCLLIGDGK